MNAILDKLQQLNDRSKDVLTAEKRLKDFILKELTKGLNVEYVGTLGDTVSETLRVWKEQQSEYLAVQTQLITGEPIHQSPEDKRKALIFEIYGMINEGENETFNNEVDMDTDGSDPDDPDFIILYGLRKDYNKVRVYYITRPDQPMSEAESLPLEELTLEALEQIAEDLKEPRMEEYD